MTLRYSRGRSISDNHPRTIEAPDFAAFVAALDADRAPRKEGAAYIAGPFNGDGRRCADGALPRRFLAADLDRIDADVLPTVRMHFASFSGCAWPTHSSTPEAPRERVLIELDRPAARVECIDIGRVLKHDLANEFGDAVLVDESTFRPEQPCFVPPTDAALARFLGEPLRVDAYLEAACALPAETRTATGRNGEAVAAAIEGEALHENVGRLVAQWAAKGMGEDAIRAAAVGLVEHARRARGPRVDEFTGAELQRLIDGALRKFAPPEQPAATPPLDNVEGFLARFVAYPSEHARVAHVLWIAHTHLMDAWDSTPRIAFLSPEPGSGKSRALEVSELLVPNPVEAINVSPAYLFRKVADEEGRPTILFDECDTIFGPKAKEHEEVRGLLNAGHRRHAVAGRCVVRGKSVITEELPAYCAVALAGLGDLPDTILTRSVIVRMRRRAPSEHVEPYRRRVHQPEGHSLRERLASWAASIESAITGAWPDMPAGIADRDADVWEALLALADAAGGSWPKRARVAAVTLVADSKRSTPSLGVRLLADLRAVFGDHEVLSTEAAIKALCALDEAPWGDLRGKPLDARGLAARLRPYGVTSKTVRLGDHTPKGYIRADLADAWARYLSASPASKTSATSATNPAGVADVAAPMGGQGSRT